MRAYAMLLAVTSTTMLAIFGVVVILDVPLLTAPDPWLRGGGLTAGVMGVGLLIADVVLPVPSSLVMVAHGALFGVLGGTLLSLGGTLGAATLGFYLGRLGSHWLTAAIPETDRRRAMPLLHQWGSLAVVVSRPLPILAESVAIVAGTTAMSWGEFLIASLLGNVVPCALFALGGASAAKESQFYLLFVLTMALATFAWLLVRRQRRSAQLAGHAKGRLNSEL
jgi:uncharacterized membrane protein YdjX (TVP38/TMEM64 family)